LYHAPFLLQRGGGQAAGHRLQRQGHLLRHRHHPPGCRAHALARAHSRTHASARTHSHIRQRMRLQSPLCPRVGPPASPLAPCLYLTLACHGPDCTSNDTEPEKLKKCVQFPSARLITVQPRWWACHGPDSPATLVPGEGGWCPSVASPAARRWDRPALPGLCPLVSRAVAMAVAGLTDPPTAPMARLVHVEIDEGRPCYGAGGRGPHAPSGVLSWSLAGYMPWGRGGGGRVCVKGVAPKTQSPRDGACEVGRPRGLELEAPDVTVERLVAAAGQHLQSFRGLGD
jgi:hypothetical protein